MINVQALVFYAFAAVLLLSALMVIISKNTVRSALFLVLTFFTSAVLWMLMEAEFLSLVLIFVYVGAVMTLFLFVVMMLNIDTAPLREGFVRYLPIGLIVMTVVVGIMLYIIGPAHYALFNSVIPTQPADYSNVKEIGAVLYTDYMYPFEIASIVLLVAIIAAISLAFRGSQNKKSQNISQQLSANPKERLRLVEMRSEKS